MAYEPLSYLIAAGPQRVYTVITDDGIHFVHPKYARIRSEGDQLLIAAGELFWAHPRELACAQNGIGFKLNQWVEAERLS